MHAVDAQIVITTLTIAAGLALAIERTIELLKHLMNSASGTLGKAEIVTLLDEAKEIVSDVKEAMAGNKHYSSIDFTQTTVTQPIATPTSSSASLSAADAESHEQYPAPAIPVVPPTPLSSQQTSRQLFYNLTAAALGITLAQLFEIRLLTLLSVNNGLPALQALPLSLLDIVFTGLVIGGGSQPIHVLIKFLTERKMTRLQEEAPEKVAAEKSADLATVIANARLVEKRPETAALQWKEILYHGGVNPASLQNTHLRHAPPNLVVYHHTAMASSHSFQDIVDEFLINKQWLTGYHCVVMPDGTIKPFCRWDRTGSHTLGHNARSLGLAFHGNFHTDAGDKFSNVDGRYGNQQATEVQLHAGARVVALWAHLYADIGIDFERSILPHKEVLPGHTVCPGSNFQYDEFKQLIRRYYQSWAESPEAQQQIAAFKQLDYVYA